MSLYVADLLPFEIDAKIVNDCLKTLSQPFIKYLADDAPAPDVIKLIVGCANAKRTPAQTNNEPQKQNPKASEITDLAKATMANRAVDYDASHGERSMGKTVAAFNAITGKNLSELDGWQFMECLKMARSRQGKFKLDNFIDGTAYAALAGEAAAQAELEKIVNAKHLASLKDAHHEQ